MVGEPGKWHWSSHNGFISGRDVVADVPAALELFGGLHGYREYMALPLGKSDRMTLEEIAAQLAGPSEINLMRTSCRESRICELRRQFVILARQHSHRNSDIAKFLGIGPSTVTMIIKRGRS